MKSNRTKPGERCEYCGEPLDRARVSFYRRRRKLHILFQRIPALVCRSCGHRLFEASAIEAMEHELNQPRPQKRTAELVIVSA